jgi:hypothetical protein
MFRDSLQVAKTTTHLTITRSEKFDKPRQDCIFDKAYTDTETEIIVYINGDVLLLNNFPKTLKHLSDRFSSFLAVGRRTDLYLDYFK